VSQAYTEYEKRLREMSALDFDDLLTYSISLFRTAPQVLEKYQEIFKYIMVDEYQDTNHVQYTITKLLAQKYKNLAVVGDMSQSIYKFRGADIRNIMAFEKDYPTARTFSLEENYRSTQTILTAANRVIAKNKVRREKNLFTKNGEGEKIGVLSAYDENDEAKFVAIRSRQLIEDKGVSPSEIAVLYRANFQGRAIEEAMLNQVVPYQVLGTRFFERKEIKDIIAYLKASLNPESLSDLKRIINVPARGLGKVTVLKVLAGQEDTLPSATRKKVSDFKKILEEIKIISNIEKPSQTIKQIIKLSGIEHELQMGGTDEEERLENIKELVTFATKFDVYENSEEGILKLLEEAALASDQDELMKNREAVKLMTVHAAKGLEFEYVFITGLEEDLFPHKKMDKGKFDERQAEEERRLFYVALTRAKKKLYLSYASVRTIFGSKQVNMPSEFLMDIDEELSEKEETFSGGGKIIYLD
jgi:DNA helicase-2/ATP-dependent DNA helicase PcrA